MDLAITYGPAVDLHLQVQSIGREDIAVVGPPGSGLNKKKHDALKWLVKQDLIVPSISHGLRALLEKAVAREKLTLNPLIEADSYRAQSSLMEEGLGYTLLPPSAIRAELAAQRLEMAALVRPPFSRELNLRSPIDHPASIAPNTISTLRMSAREAVWSLCMPVSPKRSLSSTAIVRLAGLSTAMVARAPMLISISPSPVMTSTLRFGCAIASPSPIMEAAPIAPHSGKLLG